jgi:hypothetical protein
MRVADEIVHVFLELVSKSVGEISSNDICDSVGESLS